MRKIPSLARQEGYFIPTVAGENVIWLRSVRYESVGWRGGVEPPT